MRMAWHRWTWRGAALGLLMVLAGEVLAVQPRSGDSPPADQPPPVRFVQHGIDRQFQAAGCTVADINAGDAGGDAAQGFQPLFNGKDLTGWTTDPMKYWSVDHGVIVGKTGGKLRDNRFLMTKKSYRNFVLRFKCRMVGHGWYGNSGMQFRSADPSDRHCSGYQADMGEGFWGAIYEERGRGLIGKPLPADQRMKLVKPSDQYNDYEIIADGPHIVLKLNGVTTIDYTETQKFDPHKPFVARPEGVFGIQLHVGPPEEVYFKDILIKELPGKE